MQILVRYFAEMTIKGRPVRQRLCRKLANNLQRQLRSLDTGIRVVQQWDQILVDTSLDDKDTIEAVLDCLGRTTGIAWFSPIRVFPFVTLSDVVDKLVETWAAHLTGQRFAVRCRRMGEHDFSSLDVERAAGAALLAAAPGSSVDLKEPEQTVRLELRHEQLMLTADRRQGPGGFPAGCFDPVLSLVSGGFDSMVASWLSMRRGLVTHMCLFRLGGEEHERAVEEIVYYLWLQHGGGTPVRFVSVPFEDVVANIVAEVEAPFTTIILKRCMLTAASRLARRLRAAALVTGESLAQVSSQTLSNLEVIDQAASQLVMRPLIMSSKEEIIARARQLGLDAMVSKIPEYCGAIAVNPATSSRLDRIQQQEARLNDELLDAAVQSASVRKIALIGARGAAGLLPDGPAVLLQPAADDVVIDIRHPIESERRPLKLRDTQVIDIPFYALAGQFSSLPADRRYLLYCEQGMLSRLQAGYLRELKYDNVAVLRPRSAANAKQQADENDGHQ